MGIVGSIISFLMVWWTVLFMVLPMRVRGQWEDPENMVPGTERGAPMDPALWFKIKRTTWISLIVWAVIFVIVSTGIIDLSREE